MKCRVFQAGSQATRTCGSTLPEFMVAVAIGSLLLAMAASLWLFGSRSFAAMGNYTDLDNKSRSTLDLMSRDIRQATAVTAFNNQMPNKSLTVTNTLLGTGSTYAWKASTHTLVCQKPGQPDQALLTECDTWDFQLFQRAPQKGGTYAFFPATNSAGVYDLSICKLINMSWKCSRSIIGSRLNTESVQTAQVVLRNKQ
jgi:prepilin-type N-terminal cleavage/methylation domain-containing protein